MTTQYKYLPKPPTTTMIEAGMFEMPEADNTVVAAIYDAIWQAAPEVEQEPVAYEYFLVDECRHELTSCYAEAINITDDEDIIVPLYDHPQPNREPLSEDFLLRLADECTAQFFNGVHQNATIHFARAVEQAHGIGV